MGFVAVAFLVAPLWMPALHLADSQYRYERVEVTTTDAGIEYAAPDAVPPGAAISDQIACSGLLRIRPCAFERLLLENETVPSGWYSTNPSSNLNRFSDEYRYVLLNGTVYETTTVTNSSAQRSDGLYPVELALDAVPPETALRDISRAVASHDVPPVVAETARTGDTASYRAVVPPATPIRLSNGSYYRVFRRPPEDVDPIAEGMVNLATVAASSVGFVLLVRLRHRVDVTIDVSYVGDSDR